MNNNHIKKTSFWVSILVLGTFSACTPQWLFQTKELAYTGPEIINVEPYEHILQPSDKIILSVWGHDELGVGSAFSVFSSTLEQGKYIAIDARGEITLPLIGEVKISDLSAREADLYLTKLFSKYLQDPIVYLRILSLEVTLIGEVKTPANYQLDKEPFSIIELIGEAGGFSEYADPSKIRVLRTHPDGQLEEIYFDLTDRDVLFIKDLSLRSRDVVYVPERRAKQFERTVSGKIVPLVGAIGSVALILSIVNSLEGG